MLCINFLMTVLVLLLLLYKRPENRKVTNCLSIDVCVKVSKLLDWLFRSFPQFWLQNFMFCRKMTDVLSNYKLFILLTLNSYFLKKHEWHFTESNDNRQYKNIFITSNFIISITWCNRHSEENFWKGITTIFNGFKNFIIRLKLP